MSKWQYTTQRWQRLRRAKLRECPLCEACLQRLGRVEPGVAVDHRVPIANGGLPYPPLDELASLCVSCHNQKTRHEQLGKELTPKVIKGCDAHGNPLDPNHSWYKT